MARLNDHPGRKCRKLTLELVAEHNCKHYHYSTIGSRVQLRSALDGTVQYTWAGFTDPWGVPASRTVSEILEAPGWLKRESDDKEWEIVPVNERPKAIAVTTAASSAMVCSYCQGSDHNTTMCFQKYADQYSEVRKDISKLGAALDNIEASRRNIQECMDRAFQKLDGLEKKLRELDQDGKIRRDSAAEGGGYRLDAMRKISDNQCPASSHGVNAGFQPRIAVS